MKPSILVTHQQCPIALVNRRQTTLLGPATEALSANPELRLHLYMVHYAQFVPRGQLSGP